MNVSIHIKRMKKLKSYGKLGSAKLSVLVLHSRVRSLCGDRVLRSPVLVAGKSKSLAAITSSYNWYQSQVGGESMRVVEVEDSGWNHPPWPKWLRAATSQRRWTTTTRH
jgi:hypothetical protein